MNKQNIQFFIIFLISLLLVIGALAFITTKKVSSDFEDCCSDAHTDYLNDIMMRLAYEQAAQYEIVFRKIADYTALAAKQAAFFLDNDLSHVDTLMRLIKETCSECETIYIPPHNSKEGGWIQDMTKPENNPDRKTVWTGCWFKEKDSYMFATNGAPIYDNSGLYRGAISVDVCLNRLFLPPQSIPPQTEKLGEVFSFLIDPNGKALAFPAERLKVFGFESVEGSVAILSEASIPEVRNIAKEIMKTNQYSSRFSQNGKTWIIFSKAIDSTGWRAASVLPISASDSESIAVSGFAIISIILLVLAMITVIFSVKYVGKSPTNTMPDIDEAYVEDDDDYIDADMIIEDDIVEKTIKEKKEAEENESFEDDLMAEIIEEDETGLLAHSYNKMVEALQKVNILEKQHSIELAGANRQLQKEIAERKRAEEEIRRLSSRLISGIEEGRKKLAQDLHDEFGQMLAALHLHAEFLWNALPPDMPEPQEKINKLVGLIEELGDKIRSISSDLRPDLLDDLGLIPTLQWYIHEFTAKRPDDIQVEFQHIGFRKRLPSEIELVLYRIFQEGMNNIVKHSKATHINVNLTCSYPKVILMLKDNGIGFEPTKRTEGIGLLGMRERAVSVNGTISIISPLQKGTTIRVEVPIKEVINGEKNKSDDSG